MKPEEQRIKIAEACPELFVHVPSPFGYGSIHWRKGQDDNGNIVTPGSRVDPLNDLNVMHEAEKTLNKQQIDGWGAYTAQLAKITGGYPWRNSKVFILVHATAAQRAEAFLRTLGLWTE